MSLASPKESRGWGLQIFAYAFLAFLYLPMLAIPLFSFADQIIMTFPIKGWSTKWYEAMWANEQMHTALWNSIKIGIVVSLSATLLGLLSAKAVTRYNFWGKGLASGLITLPLFIPEILLGLALLIIINVLDISLSLWTITFGHVLLCTPFAMAVLVPRLDGFDKSLEEASLDLGENGWMTFWRVTFPLIAPAIASSLLLAFMVSFDEFLLAFFIGGTEQTLPIYIWASTRKLSDLPPALAMGALILIASVFVVIFAEWLRQWGSRGAPQVGV